MLLFTLHLFEHIQQPYPVLNDQLSDPRIQLTYLIFLKQLVFPEGFPEDTSDYYAGV